MSNFDLDDLDLEPSSPSPENFVDEFYAGFQQHETFGQWLAAKVAEFTEAENSLFVLEIDDLHLHLRYSPGNMYAIGRLLARAKSDEFRKKCEVDRAKGRAWDRVVENYEKKPSDDTIARLITNDLEVISAQEAYAQALEMTHALLALFTSLQKKHDLMYGMQGQMNALFRADNSL